MRDFVWALIYSCSLESGVHWCSQVWELILLTLAFILILTVASILLHPYRMDDTTSWLMVKQFSTTRDTQRSSQTYMEKRRGKREIEVTRRRSSAQLLSYSRLFVTPWTTACQASLSITNSQCLPKFMSIESVMPSNHLILCRPLLLLPSVFPSIRVFSNESFLRIGWPEYCSFSFSMNI